MTPDELTLISVNGAAWIRMLRTKEDRVLAKIYGEFKNGKTDHLTSLAEFACVRDQINEITAAIRQHNEKKGKE